MKLPSGLKRFVPQYTIDAAGNAACSFSSRRCHNHRAISALCAGVRFSFAAARIVEIAAGIGNTDSLTGPATTDNRNRPIKCPPPCS
jgi:hypothetical protein